MLFGRHDRDRSSVVAHFRPRGLRQPRSGTRCIDRVHVTRQPAIDVARRDSLRYRREDRPQLGKVWGRSEFRYGEVSRFRENQAPHQIGPAWPYGTRCGHCATVPSGSRARPGFDKRDPASDMVRDGTTVPCAIQALKETTAAGAIHNNAATSVRPLPATRGNRPTTHAGKPSGGPDPPRCKAISWPFTRRRNSGPAPGF
jgi:hypothetical protein